MNSTFVEALIAGQREFGIELTEQHRTRLAGYYALIQKQNPILHLVGPCSPEEFATRHVLESLVLLKHLPQRAKFADVGTGAGLPSIPCLLVRDDLEGTLIESKIKKARFLTETVAKLGINGRARVVNKQFSETKAGDSTFVTCRALDRFADKLPGLLKWSGHRTLLLFGGKNLRDGLDKAGLTVEEELIPMSEQRYLYIAKE